MAGDANAVLHAADLALYEAKNAGAGSARSALSRRSGTWTTSQALLDYPAAPEAAIKQQFWMEPA